MEQDWGSKAALLALVLWAYAASQEENLNLGTNFESKVARLLIEEPSNPKCFTERLSELTCFWETSEHLEDSNNTYTFSYQYEYESWKQCALTVENTSRNTTRYSCRFPAGDVSVFACLEIEVFDRRFPNSTLYARNVSVDKIVFVDPPHNLTVQPMELHGQLNVSWLPFENPYLKTNIHYEVNIFSKAQSQRVDVTGRTYCFLANLKGQTRYTLTVRAKPDGTLYDGYWSAWSLPVSVVTPSDLDPLIVTLSVVLVLIVLLLTFIALMSHCRFLKKKIWPAIPSPEHEFKELFTIYQGNFQLWLGHQGTYQGCSPTSPYLEEQPFPLEILSECDSHKVDDPPPPPLPPKTRGLLELLCSSELAQDDYLVLDEDLVPCCPGSDGDSLLLLDTDSNEGTDRAQAEGVGTPESSQVSSSFEYTVLDPSSESLSPQTHQTKPQHKNSYRMVSDSGISADYSPLEASLGPASLYTNLCDGGLQPQPFLPTYTVCS